VGRSSNRPFEGVPSNGIQGEMRGVGRPSNRPSEGVPSNGIQGKIRHHMDQDKER
jgi:hypothetical protein